MRTIVDRACATLTGLFMTLLPGSTALAQASGMYAATFVPPGTHGAVQVLYGTQVASVRVGHALPAPRRWQLFASDDTNQRYQLVLEYDRHASLSETAVFLIDGAPVDVGHVGRDSEKAYYWFTVDRRATADLIASRFGITREDRAPVGEGVVGRFSTARRAYRTGESIPVDFVLENPAGGPAVQWQVGGRQRGPRDNRFGFTVYRDGQRLPALAGADFGGPGGFVAMPPGTSVPQQADLSRWADVSAPGHYRVECRYETTFAPAGVDPYSPGHRGQAWDRVFTGTVEFDVAR